MCQNNPTLVVGGDANQGQVTHHFEISNLNFEIAQLSTVIKNNPTLVVGEDAKPRTGHTPL